MRDIDVLNDSDRSSVLVYNFSTSTVSGIPLANSATGESVSPVAASASVDGTLIYIAGSDGTLHQISTTSGADLLQIPRSEERRVGKECA